MCRVTLCGCGWWWYVVSFCDTSFYLPLPPPPSPPHPHHPPHNPHKLKVLSPALATDLAQSDDHLLRVPGVATGPAPRRVRGGRALADAKGLGVDDRVGEVHLLDHAPAKSLWRPHRIETSVTRVRFEKVRREGRRVQDVDRLRYPLVEIRDERWYGRGWCDRAHAPMCKERSDLLFRRARGEKLVPFPSSA